jgi:hypothetical protein
VLLGAQLQAAGQQQRRQLQMAVEAAGVVRVQLCFFRCLVALAAAAQGWEARG